MVLFKRTLPLLLLLLLHAITRAPQDPPVYQTVADLDEQQQQSAGPQPSGTQPSGPQPSGPQPSGPQPSGPQTNTGGTVQQQQPMNTAGPGQTFLPLQAYPQPVYYAGSPYPMPGYLPMTTYPMVQQPNNPMIIRQQPTTVPTTRVIQPSVGDNYLTLSVLMSVLVFILGGWPSYLCTIAAVLISLTARNEERRGNIASARAKGNISLGLNVAAVVFTIMMWTVVAIPVAVTVNASRYTPQYCPTQYYCSTLSCYNSSNSSSCYRYYYYAYSSSLNNATYCYTYFSYYSYYYCAYYG